AIMFADIMLPLASLGIGFEIREGGPVVDEPIRSMEQIRGLPRIAVKEAVPAVMEAISLVRGELNGRVPLIGFSGAPLTLACYLVDGRPSREFSETRSFMFREPHAWDELMTRLTDMVVEYLTEQAAAGVQAVQLFDSWVGGLGPSDMERFVLPYTRRIFDAIAHLGLPRINFGTNTHGFLELMAAPDCEVVGVDWRVPLDEAWRRIGPDRGIQGNLDPAVLFGPPDLIKARVKDVMDRAGGRPGHIFNLGHGVLPGTPLDSLKLMVDEVHAS
ncbi:MAG TPA: uroporphyrinogen decarboxylase, partial [Actinomycetota bacterium]|nr:uroporphyrinogen decarboxylase [Actinomycetota bacterium]